MLVLILLPADRPFLGVLSVYPTSIIEQREECKCSTRVSGRAAGPQGCYFYRLLHPLLKGYIMDVLATRALGRTLADADGVISIPRALLP